MSASQISFSDFALAAQQSAIPCAPPVVDTALAVVAHPLAVDGGGCIRVGSVLSGRFGCSLELRDDFRDGFICDEQIGFSSGAGMDAPRDLPSGSHTSFVCGAGYPWAYLVVDGCCALRQVCA